MKNEKTCNIIQDLLPNYIDNLTNEETNIFIEEHLDTCNNCKNILENMKNIELIIRCRKVPEKAIILVKKKMYNIL